MRSEKFDKTKAAFMGHFAENDSWGAGPEEVSSVEKRLVAARRKVTFYTYASKQHLVLRGERPSAYDPDAAKLGLPLAGIFRWFLVEFILAVGRAEVVGFA